MIGKYVKSGSKDHAINCDGLYNHSGLSCVCPGRPGYLRKTVLYCKLCSLSDCTFNFLKILKENIIIFKKLKKEGDF